MSVELCGPLLLAVQQCQDDQLIVLQGVADQIRPSLNSWGYTSHRYSATRMARRNRHWGSIRTLATTLAVSADDLIFGEGKRGPDDQLKLQFEALRQLNDHEKLVANEILDSLILKHTANRLAG